VAQAGLELVMLLLQFPKCWDYKWHHHAWPWGAFCSCETRWPLKTFKK
jgi:hypothetical protein